VTTLFDVSEYDTAVLGWCTDDWELFPSVKVFNHLTHKLGDGNLPLFCRPFKPRPFQFRQANSQHFLPRHGATLLLQYEYNVALVYAMKESKSVDLQCGWCGSCFSRAESDFKKAVREGKSTFYCNQACSNKSRSVVINIPLSVEFGVDTENAFLGRLCRSNHDFKGSGCSLRSKTTKNCKECDRLSSEGYRKTQAYRSSYSERVSSPAHKEKKRQYLRSYEKTERRKEYKREYRRTEVGLAAKKRRHQKRRALSKQLHSAQWSFSEWSNVLARFDNSCAYCGIKSSVELDHFIPVAHGGSNCLGNIVPSCKRCNTSKRDNDPVLWYKSQPFYSAKRLKEIMSSLNVLANDTAFQIPLF
jgi:5-methylcytosine-specific restriction endonuclease McrA